jgi:AcrR family transcriptional regulator
MEGPSCTPGRPFSFTRQSAIVAGMATASPGKPDGRILRSERSRDAIITALLELITSGSLMPTAEKVAERAGVGIRTVFRHFNDMETLFAEMVKQTSPRIFPYLETEPEAGPLEARVSGLVKRRRLLFERYENQISAMMLVRWRSPAMDAQTKRIGLALKQESTRWLPEILAADRGIQNAFEAALAYRAWDQLRNEQGLGAARAAAAMQATVLALLAGLEGK